MEQIEIKRCQSCGRKIQRIEDRGINADGKRSDDYCHMCYMNGKFTHPDITMEEIIGQGAKEWSEHDQDISYEQAKKELNKIIPKLKRWKKSSKKAIIISGLVAGVVAFIIDMVFFLNPLISETYSQYIDLIKPTNYLAWLFGSLFSTFFLAILYFYTERGIGIKSIWKKGLFFGFLFWLVSSIPISYFIWLKFNYPDIIIMETINRLIGNIITGILLATIYKKLK